MIVDDEIKAFLQARMLLPNADEYNGKFILISQDNDEAYIVSDHLIQTNAAVHTFLFKKSRSYGRMHEFEWTCTDQRLQHIIFNNDIFATLTLLKACL